MNPSLLADRPRRLGCHARALAFLATLALAGRAAGAQGEPPFDEPEGIAVEADGQLLVVELAGRALLRVDPITGERTLVSDDSHGGGPFFATPADLAMDATGAAIVADPGLPALLRVDPTSGDRSILSDADTGAGPLWVEPLSLAVEQDGSIVVVDRACWQSCG